MIIVKLQGGLGNQLFQYALFRTLLEMGKDAKMDIWEYEHYKHHYGYELTSLFNITEIFASKKECKELANFNSIYLHSYEKLLRRIMYNKFRRKIITINNTKKTTHIAESELRKKTKKNTWFLENIFDFSNEYLDGFWASEKYFIHVSNILREELIFNNKINVQNKTMISKISVCNSVSIHVRRGDYVTTETGYENLGSTNYYNNAIKFINQKIQNPIFFVFSDDIDWCKNNLHFNNIIFVDINKNYDSKHDLQLMSTCKHNIIANSTFSWWGAWLNNNKEKIVLCPQKYQLDNDFAEIFPASWIRISSD